MNFLKKASPFWVVPLLTLLIFSSCKKFSGDVTVPSFLHVDNIIVTPQAENAPSTEAGFYTSLVDAVQIICLFDGDMAETNLGTFQLPCTVPVLRSGKPKYVTIIPCVKQNGISGTRIEYPYYQYIQLTDVTLTTGDTTFLGTYDTATDRWNLETHYYTLQRMDILCDDYFEPTTFSTHFDSTLTWVRNDPQNACSGQGYGLVHVTDSMQTLTFSIPQEFNPDPKKYLYLEMDYWTDVELQVNMAGFITTSQQASTFSVIMLYANTHWQKIYINLGKTWSQFNYNVPIAIALQAVNTKGVTGDVRIDNFKIVAI